MHKKIVDFESSQIKNKFINFSIGDTIVVSVKIVEEGKTRLQDFEGIVIAKKGSGNRVSFTLRRISYGEGVERVFPMNSPFIDKITIKKKGKTRRAKLYFLRTKVGKTGKIEEKIEKTEVPGENALPREEGA